MASTIPAIVNVNPNANLGDNLSLKKIVAPTGTIADPKRANG